MTPDPDYTIKNPLTNEVMTGIFTDMVEDPLEASITMAVDRALEHQHDVTLFRCSDGRYIGRAVYESNFDDTGDAHAEFKRADVVAEVEADEQPDLVTALRRDAADALQLLADARQPGASKSNLEWAVDQAIPLVRRIWEKVREGEAS